MTRNEIKNKVFDKICVIYNKLINDYHISTINKELDDIDNEIEELIQQRQEARKNSLQSELHQVLKYEETHKQT